MKRVKGVKVAICVPSMGTWMSKTATSMANMLAYYVLHRGEDWQYVLINVESSMLSKSRELLVKKAMQEQATHILFLDADMIFPMELATRWAELDKDFIAANCTTRTFPVYTTAHDFQNEKIISRGKQGVQRVQQVGLAVCMVKASVIQKLRPPLFLMDWIPSLGAYCGEDIYFTQKLAEKGVDLYIDHTISNKIHHIGYYEYGHEEVEPAVENFLEERKANAGT